MELKDSIPPQNLEAEQATLGAMLLDWSSVNEVASFLRAEHFYTQQNQIIYDGLMQLFSQGNKGDIITLIDILTKNGNLQAAGGVDYISALTNTVPTAANLSYYAKIVLDCATRRSLIKISSEIKADSFDESKTSRVILDDAQQKLFKLTDTNQTSQIYGMKDVVPEAIRLIDTRYKNRSAFSGITSGLTDLDTMTSGFQDGEMIIIGARPSMGKTALALSMMQHIAVDEKIPCGFFSLEMSAGQIIQRLISQVARISGRQIRSGMLKIEDFQKLQEAAGVIYDAPLYICDTPNMKLLDLRAQARRMVVDKSVKIIFIDYIGLITSEHEDRQIFEQVSEISKSLKSLARDLKIPLVILCQVARSAEGNEPGLGELRGSGSIEQDADVVMFIHGERKEDGPIKERKIIVAKQRNGPVGEIKTMFLSSYTKFENAAKEDSY